MMLLVAVDDDYDEQMGNPLRSSSFRISFAYQIEYIIDKCIQVYESKKKCFCACYYTIQYIHTLCLLLLLLLLFSPLFSSNHHRTKWVYSNCWWFRCGIYLFTYFLLFSLILIMFSLFFGSICAHLAVSGFSYVV